MRSRDPRHGADRAPAPSRCPTLVATGELDVSTPLVGHGDRLLATIPGARHVHLVTGYLAPLESPESLADAITLFLRD